MVSLRDVDKIIKKSDVVFVQSIGPIGSAAINIGKKEKKKVVAFVHYLYWDFVSKNRFLRRVIRNFALAKTKKLYKKCSLLIVPSIRTSSILEKVGIKNAKVVVNIGIDIEKFKPYENKEKAKEKIGIQTTQKVIGYVGRLSREKDLMTLYKSFKAIEKKYNNLLLLIVGRGNNKIERLFKKEANIRLIKLTNNVVPYFQAMDIFVMPSLTETSSIATIEAMACALPVIVTKTGDMEKYIKDKENGLLFSKRNDTLLSLKIEWLLKEDYVRSSLGLNARDTVHKLFRSEDMKKEIRRILEGSESVDDI